MTGTFITQPLIKFNIMVNIGLERFEKEGSFRNGKMDERRLIAIFSVIAIHRNLAKFERCIILRT
jgi:hypothetical protein